MYGEPDRAVQTRFEREQQTLNQGNRAAVLTMWIGIASILSLLLSCFLGSLWHSSDKMGVCIFFMILLLIVSVVLFFTASKRDELWFVVCSLLNHFGIGLAVVILMDVLKLDVRVLQLAMSGLPSAVLLFGIALYYVGMEPDQKSTLLSIGAAFFLILLFVALLRFYDQRTEFWLCTAVCALLSCTNLGALIWTNKDIEQRSIYKALAVASFLIYLILAIIAIAAVFLSASGKSDRNSNKKKSVSSKRKREFGNTQTAGAVPHPSGAVAAADSAPMPVSGRRYSRSSRFWYYNLFYTSNTQRSLHSTDDLPEEERVRINNRIRRRRWIVLCVVAIIVILLIVLAVCLGRR